MMVHQMLSFTNRLWLLMIHKIGFWRGFTGFQTQKKTLQGVFNR
jgi:hypothetical protein